MNFIQYDKKKMKISREEYEAQIDSAYGDYMKQYADSQAEYFLQKAQEEKERLKKCLEELKREGRVDDYI